MKALTTTEKKRLDECESIVAQHKDSWFQAGMALAEIRDDRLYRATHANFSAYLREKWDLGKSHAYRLIGESEVAASISPKGEIPEGAARELARVEPKVRKAVIREATKGGKPLTTSGVKSVLDSVPVKSNGVSPKGEIPTAGRGRPKKPKITADDLRAATKDRRKAIKSGQAYVTPAIRKETNRIYGQLVRSLERMGLFSKAEKHLEAILTLIKEAT